MKKKVTVTQTGRDAIEMIATGLEVNAEIALEERQCVQGLDQGVLDLVEKHGLVAVLAAIHCAAWSAAEVHEDTDDVEDMSPFRLRMFGRRLGEAMNALK